MRALVFLSFIVLLVGCNHSDNGASQNVTIHYDTEGDGAFSFIDIKSVSILKNSRSVTVNMELMEIPDVFTYDSANVPDGVPEYEWRIDIDLDSDGGPSGNLKYHFSSIKNAGDVESTGAFLDFLDFFLYYYDTSKSPSIEIISGETITVSGNTVTITVDNRSHQAVESLDQNSPVRVVAVYWPNAGPYTDNLPNGSGYDE